MSSSYFLTFLYLPPAEDAARVERFLYEGRDQTENADAREVLREFVDRTDRVLQLVEGFMPECAWLDDPETLTYLHSCVSTKRHRVRLPEIPMYLDALLADQPLTGGLKPIVGASHLRVLTVIGFPTATIARNTRRAEPPGIPISMVDARDHARQDGCHEIADEDPPAMVCQEEVDRRYPERGDDERGVDAARYGRRQ